MEDALIEAALTARRRGRPRDSRNRPRTPTLSPDRGRYLPLRDYGVVGNLETCLLVGRLGSVDWACLPHLESPSVFAALLDADKGGRFRVSPVGHFESRQAYEPRTNILRTTFHSPSRTLVLTDFLPPRSAPGLPEGAHRMLLRRLEAPRASVDVDVVFEPRFDYAQSVPIFTPRPDGVDARWRDGRLLLDLAAPWRLRSGGADAQVRVPAGGTQWLVLRWGTPGPIDATECGRRLDLTRAYWHAWAHRCPAEGCRFAGAWHDHVVRSDLALKLLTHPETGAIAAAPTTSLPGVIGGARNWDYRFAWIRDAADTIRALRALSHDAEAAEYLRWLEGLGPPERASPAGLRALSGLHPEADLRERTLPHLEGYRGSAPVRVGNAATDQVQLDIFGELVNLFYETVHDHRDSAGEVWDAVARLADHACRIWDRPDTGVWEVRSPPRHFVHSKVLCWSLLDRALRLAPPGTDPAALERWNGARTQIREAVLRRGYHVRLGSFVQAFGSRAVDATALLIPYHGFLPYDDPRIVSTIETVRRRLGHGVWVRRYDGDDGLPGREGAFVQCSFWLVIALAATGRRAEAKDLFENVLAKAGPLGLWSEEVDPDTDEFLGNYPLAYSHIGLITAALALTVPTQDRGATGSVPANDPVPGTPAEPGSTPSLRQEGTV